MSLAAIITRSQTDKESWKYTNVDALLKKFSSSHSPPPLTQSLRASNPLSHDKVVSSATPPSFTFLNGVLQTALSQLDDLPANIMSGDAASGYRLVLAGQTCLVTQPIEFLFLTTDGAPSEITTKLHVELGASGRLTLRERHEFAGQVQSPHILETNIVLGAQAKLVHVKIVRGENAPHLATTQASIAEGAYYDNFAALLGGRLIRNEIDATLAGKLAQCNLHGIMLLRNDDHADTTTRITHAAPHGTSREVYKSVVGGHARGVFQGKIFVKEGAQKTDGYQLSRALLLSDQAEMNAKPELEIYADDVKCSHGSTVGDLDAEALFYLRARGLSEAAARAMLIRAFIDEVVDELQVEEWRAQIRTEVGEWLDDQS